MKKEYISDLMLERYLLGELPEEQLIKFDRIKKEDPEIRSRIDKIKESDLEIQEKYPSRDIAAEIKRRYNNSEAGAGNDVRAFKPVYRRFMLPSALVAAAAVVLFFVLPVIKPPVGDVVINDTGTTRIKSTDTRIYLYRKNNNEIEMLKNGSSAGKGDLLQIAYSSFKDDYGIILSIDGNGYVTLHYPADRNGSTKLIKKKKVLLNNSYELDDAPDFERFFFITSGNSLNINAVLHAAERLAGDKNSVKKNKLEITGVEAGKVNQVSVLIMKGN
jgi:hypothetical protein